MPPDQPLDQAIEPSPGRVALTERLLARAESDALMVEVLSATGGPSRRWTYRQLVGAARLLAVDLRERGSGLRRPLRVGLLAGNSAEFVAADLAALFARAVEIPVPTQFAADQAAALLAEADLCLVDSEGAARLREWSAAGAPVVPAGCPVLDVPVATLAARATSAPPPRVRDPAHGHPGSYDLSTCDQRGADDRGTDDRQGVHDHRDAHCRQDPHARTSPHGRQDPQDEQDAVIKVVHTSGTTSAPKGVRIRLHGLETLLASLLRHVDQGDFTRYLSIVPLSLLIEQVAGLYMPFLVGGSVTFLPPGTSLVGTAADAGPRMLSLLRQARPSAMVVPPVMAGLLLALCEQHPEETVAQRHRRIFGHDGPVFIACGGAPVPAQVLERLAGFGITLYEGYGLSENSSVVSWNVPGQCRFGTAGRPLAHVRAELAEDGELLIRSDSLFAGYVGADPSSMRVDEQGRLHTGDLATIDEDGYLRITGRKKNVVITAGGRNVSPEWVEARYRELDLVREAVIVAEGLDRVHGLFVVDATADPDEARDRIERFGRERLSAIERAAVVRLMPEDDPAYRACFTVTGRPRRDAVREHLLGTPPGTPLAAPSATTLTTPITTTQKETTG